MSCCAACGFNWRGHCGVKVGELWSLGFAGRAYALQICVGFGESFCEKFDDMKDQE